MAEKLRKFLCIFKGRKNKFVGQYMSSIPNKELNSGWSTKKKRKVLDGWLGIVVS